MTATAEMETSAAGRLLSLAQSIGDAEPADLARLRTKGIESFAALGLPHTRLEAWRYTNVAPAMKAQLSLPDRNAAVDSDAIKPLLGTDCLRIVFVNGLFSAAQSDTVLPEGLIAGSLADAATSHSMALRQHLGRYADHQSRHFVALNAALQRDGAFVQIAAGAVIEPVIHLLFISAPVPGTAHIAALRNLVIAGPNSQCTIVETYATVAPGGYVTSTVTEIVAGDGAVMDHTVVQSEDESAGYFASIAVRLERASRFTQHAVSLGAAIARTDIDVILAGQGAGVTLDGLYMARGTQHVDFHTTIDHTVPQCESLERYKGIIDDSGRGVFDGRVVVRPDAQKTSSAQENRNLLLSANAIADSKPQLEIHADDVKCTHGSTIGQIDENTVFYLRSRGIGESDARAILTSAFASEVVDRIRPSFVRASIDHELQKRLPGAALVSRGDR